MEDIKHFLVNNDQFAKHCGMELLEVAKGYAKAKMTIKDYHLNGVKTVHGGAIFTLADYTFAAASNSHGRAAVAVDATVSFTKAAVGGELYAEAQEKALSYKLGHYTVSITDSQGDVIALFQGTVYRKSEDLLAEEKL